MSLGKPKYDTDLMMRLTGFAIAPSSINKQQPCHQDNTTGSISDEEINSGNQKYDTYLMTRLTGLATAPGSDKKQQTRHSYNTRLQARTRNEEDGNSIDRMSRAVFPALSTRSINRDFQELRHPFETSHIPSRLNSTAENNNLDFLANVINSLDRTPGTRHTSDIPTNFFEPGDPVRGFNKNLYSIPEDNVPEVEEMLVPWENIELDFRHDFPKRMSRRISQGSWSSTGSNDQESTVVHLSEKFSSYDGSASEASNDAENSRGALIRFPTSITISDDSMEF